MRGGKKPSTLLLAEKNCSFKREFRIFIAWHFLFFKVCLAELIKEQGGAGKSAAVLVSFGGAGNLLELLLGGKLNRKEGRGDEMGASLMGSVKTNNDHIHSSNDFHS